ncbi:Bacteriophage protein (modular protein) [uncultured Pleomorphomonas sp.]|uniref:Bacteriophage protein (Modular protein) n=1 Tax=uncultured Pleomorphomonas sp. TaxID=442121 RepID=A0A212LQR0_9HYPH|nr:hypothetical protein [uncultured Pleomorphomonas sp.]SCM79846.1 Bacteriophage protein (modular protein) [uncultured Pleomorphomonas sp.]
MSNFKFKLGAIVALTHSPETGEVIGRAEYTTTENNYLVRYRAGDGRQTEAWWGESAIRAAGEQPSDAAAAYVGEAAFVGEPLKACSPVRIVILDTLGDLNDILSKASPLPTA